MEIYYWKGAGGVKNFGDEINTILWRQLLPPSFFSINDSTLVGIGTLLNHHLPLRKNLIVFGAGAGYGPIPAHLNKCKIYCVRGPVSAYLLGLDASYGICDPAILLSEIDRLPAITKKSRFGYMPHWINNSNTLATICNTMGIIYIDPTQPVEIVINYLKSVDVLITEAMHGAIVADAYRIPWIPVCDQTNPHTLAGKWVDWCASVNLKYQPLPMPSLKPANAFNSSIVTAEVERALKYAVQKGKPTISKSKVLEGVIDKLKTKLFNMANDYQVH